MANKVGRRQFGWIRRLPSKRYQASYIAPDGLRRTAPETFATKGEAGSWLTLRESELLRGEWVDPDLGKISLAHYGKRWIAEHRISDRTRELYESLFRLHISPFLGDKALDKITTEAIRSWRNRLLAEGRSETTAAKAYRLLRAILNTAVDDGRVRRNPCRIKGADKEHAPERPVASVGQVYRLADAVGERFRGLVLAAAFTGLRWGELVGLRRMDLDLDREVIRVPRKLAQLNSGQLVAGPTKSVAGLRSVTIPPHLVDDLRAHLAELVGPEPTSLVFTGAKGAPLKRGNWRRTVGWADSVARAGLPEGFHFHDLRHTGNHLAAMAGASTRELMHRMGHGSMRAALVYQHATDERARQIAAALSDLVARQSHAAEEPADEGHAGPAGDLESAS